MKQLCIECFELILLLFDGLDETLHFEDEAFLVVIQILNRIVRYWKYVEFSEFALVDLVLFEDEGVVGGSGDVLIGRGEPEVEA